MIATTTDWVQALSAVAIAALTFVLVRSTARYVTETRKLADEARRTNDAAQANTERLLRASAPRLDVTLPSGPMPPDTPAIPADVRFIYMVRNVGSSAAHDIVLTLDAEEVRVPQPLIAGATTIVFEPGEAERPPPAIRSVVFRDPAGTRWRQASPLPGKRWTQGRQHFPLSQLPEMVPEDDTRQIDE